MPLNFTDVREVWDIIKPGLEVVAKDQQPDWRLEDVYASLANGQSHLLTDPSRTKTGFMVVQSVPVPFRKASKLLIWIAYDPVPESLATYAVELEALARNTGHTQIEFLTPHQGLWSLGASYGYSLKWATLNKTL